MSKDLIKERARDDLIASTRNAIAKRDLHTVAEREYWKAIDELKKLVGGDRHSVIRNAQVQIGKYLTEQS